MISPHRIFTPFLYATHSSSWSRHAVWDVPGTYSSYNWKCVPFGLLLQSPLPSGNHKLMSFSMSLVFFFFFLFLDSTYK